LGSDLRVVVARELTKMHEEFLRATVAEARRDLTSRDRVRGEITLLVEVLPRSSTAKTASDESIAARVARLQAESGIDEKEALKRVARNSANRRATSTVSFSGSERGSRSDRA